MEEINKFTYIVDLPFKKLSEAETELFIELCRILRRSETNTCKIDFKALKSITDQDILSTSLVKMNKKLVFELSNDENTETMHIIPFSVCSINDDTVTLKCTENFMYFLKKDICLSAKDIKLIRKLSFKYSAKLYVNMLEHMRNHKWDIALEDFRRLFNIPQSYKPAQIKERIIDLAIKELKEYNSGLECKVEYGNKENTMAISGYLFTM